MSSASRPHESVVAGPLIALMEADGWAVDIEPAIEQFHPDLVARKGMLRYAVGLKSVAEGRPDRVLALLAQAILQASRYAAEFNMRPLAVVVVAGRASNSLMKKVEQFQRDYAPDASVGLVSEAGGSLFIGPGLEGLNREQPRARGIGKSVQPRKASNLFSDLNQWMLKVLLAPELPVRLLSAPRGVYATGSDLAGAARVSAMSASRFVRRMQEEGFLDDSGRALRLVRRGELFRRWQSAALRSSPELRMAYLIPAPVGATAGAGLAGAGAIPVCWGSRHERSPGVCQACWSLGSLGLPAAVRWWLGASAVPPAPGRRAAGVPAHGHLGCRRRIRAARAAARRYPREPAAGWL